jgi:hypothetical protein
MEDVICLKKFVGDGFIERGLCAFLTWERGKEIRSEKKNYQKRIWTWEKLREKNKQYVFYLWEYRK